MPKTTKPRHTEDFICFYCGKRMPPDQESREHIVPQCIGGGVATETWDVCAACNKYMGDHVDLPFGRDWFIQSERLFGRVKNGGDLALHYFGRVIWGRPETVDVLFVDGGVTVFVVTGTDQAKRLCFAWQGDAAAEPGAIRKLLKQSPFKGLPVINQPPPDAVYDLELRDALIKAIGKHPRFSMPPLCLVAWEREVVKMGLGLTCLAVGNTYIKSAAAEKLRSFLFEEDPDRRDAVGLKGFLGLQDENRRKLTAMIHPGNGEHLFLLYAVGSHLAFVANLFGRYENAVEVDEGDHIAAGYLTHGRVRIVEPATRHTRGPMTLDDIMRKRSATRREMTRIALGLPKK